MNNKMDRYYLPGYQEEHKRNMELVAAKVLETAMEEIKGANTMCELGSINVRLQKGHLEANIRGMHMFNGDFRQLVLKVHSASISAEYYRVVYCDGEITDRLNTKKFKAITKKFEEVMAAFEQKHREVQVMRKLLGPGNWD